MMEKKDPLCMRNAQGILLWKGEKKQSAPVS